MGENDAPSTNLDVSKSDITTSMSLNDGTKGDDPDTSAPMEGVSKPDAEEDGEIVETPTVDPKHTEIEEQPNVTPPVANDGSDKDSVGEKAPNTASALSSVDLQRVKEEVKEDRMVVDVGLASDAVEEAAEKKENDESLGDVVVETVELPGAEEEGEKKDTQILSKEIRTDKNVFVGMESRDTDQQSELVESGEGAHKQDAGNKEAGKGNGIEGTAENDNDASKDFAGKEDACKVDQAIEDKSKDDASMEHTSRKEESDPDEKREDTAENVAHDGDGSNEDIHTLNTCEEDSSKEDPTEEDGEIGESDFTKVKDSTTDLMEEKKKKIDMLVAVTAEEEKKEESNGDHEDETDMKAKLTLVNKSNEEAKCQPLFPIGSSEDAMEVDTQKVENQHEALEEDIQNSATNIGNEKMVDTEKEAQGKEKEPDGATNTGKSEEQENGPDEASGTENQGDETAHDNSIAVEAHGNSNNEDRDILAVKLEISEEKLSVAKKPRRSSPRQPVAPRTLRPRGGTRAGTEKPVEGHVEQENPQGQSVSTTNSVEPTGDSEANPPDAVVSREDDLPKPVLEANGMCMRVDDASFVTEDQLNEFKVARLTDKKVKPFEQLTFQDLRTYNRDQLRAYCYAYGMTRRKKTEMEADMARYLSYWNRGRPGFDLSDYKPTSQRVMDRVEPSPMDATPASRGPASANPSSTSRDGSVTPSISDARGATSTRHGSSRRASISHNEAAISSAAVRSNSTRSNGLATNSVGSSGAHRGYAAGSAQGTAVQRASFAANKSAKANSNPVHILPRGFNTSFKQRVHAKQSGAKFKAAYNGAGPAIVNIVENAAAYFEGKDTPEVIVDKNKSYERYQFNVDMLTEIFDSVPSETGDENDEMKVKADTVVNEDAKKIMAEARKEVLGDLAKHMVSGKRKAQEAELDHLQKKFMQMEDRTKYTERTNMKLFQRLERAETQEQIEAVQKEFEKENNIKLDEVTPPPLVRRKLDKSRSPLIMSDKDVHILRFKLT